jgi:hypothetical protein
VQAPSPIDNGGIGTISLDLICYFGLGPVPAGLAPYEQPYLRRERLPQRHRLRLALVSIAPHNPAMPRPNSRMMKGILAKLPRETIERDRFPLSPRIKQLRPSHAPSKAVRCPIPKPTSGI